MQFDRSLESPFPVDTWLMLQGRIWTADRLLLREWLNDYFCPFCRRNLETGYHPFVECPVSRLIWTTISCWAKLPRLSSRNWNADKPLGIWFNELSALSKPKAKGVQSLGILVCWSLWQERNVRIFEKVEKTMQRLVEEIKDEAKQWVSAGAKQLSKIVETMSSE
jgi:hypothetical protein